MSAPSVFAGAPLAGKVALVTGGGKNIGRAVALGLAAAGADVALLGKSDRAALDETADAVRSAKRRAMALLADVSDEASVNRAAKAAAEKLGGPTLLVNNAAVRRNTGFADLTFAEWREITGVILDGAFLCARAVLPFMRAAGGGAIVNLGGLSASVGARGRAHVIAAKSGVSGLTRALAVDLAEFGVRVNCVAPGMISTVRGDSAGAPPKHPGDNRPLTGAPGRPEDVAAMVVFLASPAAKHITGQTIHVNGGLFLT